MSASPVSQNKKRLLIVEHDRLLYESLDEILCSNGFEVDLLSNGESIPGKMERNRFDLIVLSLSSLKKDGFYWMKWLRNYYPSVPVIFISSKMKPEDRLSGLQAGARDYICKPFHFDELLIRIKFLVSEYSFKLNSQQKSSVIEIGDFNFDSKNGSIERHGEYIPLTELECKILRLLYINVGLPMSREDLMWQTMGVRYVPSNRSIDTHINRLRKKIEDVPSQPVYIRTLRGRGYCFSLPAAAYA